MPAAPSMTDRRLTTLSASMPLLLRPGGRCKTFARACLGSVNRCRCARQELRRIGPCDRRDVVPLRGSPPPDRHDFGPAAPATDEMSCRCGGPRPQSVTTSVQRRGPRGADVAWPPRREEMAMSESVGTAGRSIQLLVDGFGRIRESVDAVVDGLDTDQLSWRPDGSGNSIGWLVWHLTRIQDDHLADAAGDDQVWTGRGGPNASPCPSTSPRPGSVTRRPRSTPYGSGRMTCGATTTTRTSRRSGCWAGGTTRRWVGLSTSDGIPR